jgi:hypothetical protein
MDNPLQNGINGEEHHPPREQLLLYVDMELTPKGAARIEKHLGLLVVPRPGQQDREIYRRLYGV